MNKPVVVYVVQPSKAIVPTNQMRWGGSHRLSFWHLQALSRCGLDLHVVVPEGSNLDLPDAEVVVSSTAPLLSLPEGKQAAGLTQWTKDVVGLIERVRPDVILIQGPDVRTLRAIPAEFVDKTIFCSHYNFKTQPARRKWLVDHPEVSITAVSEIHRAAMGVLRERAVVTRAGVPVDTYRLRPKVERPTEPTLKQVAEAFDRSDGRLLSQVDRLSHDKSQAAAIRAFLASNLPEHGWVFIVGGDEFINGVPDSVSPKDKRVQYAKEVAGLVAQSKGSVILLGPLGGHEVEEVYGASRFVIAPYGLDLPGYFEAFGLAPAIAQSVGTPVIASGALDHSIVEDGVSGVRIDNEDELFATLQQLSSINFDRRSVREWAENHQGLDSTVSDYAKLIAHRAAIAGKRWQLSAPVRKKGLAAITMAVMKP